MGYLGRQIQKEGSYKKLDDISSQFDGTETEFDLTSSSVAVIPGKAENLLINLNDTLQEPIADYTVSGDKITFSSAPANGTTFFGRILGDVYNCPNSTPVSLNDLSDVTVGTPSTKDVLEFNGTQWVSVTRELNDNSDVDAASPNDNDVLTYNSATSQWEAAASSGGGASALNDLSDVTINSPSNNDVLTYNSATSQWEAAASSGGGSVAHLNDIGDVDVSGVNNGNLIYWDNVNSEWTHSSLGDLLDNYSTFDNISNVNVDSSNDYDVLVYYDGSWFNSQIGLRSNYMYDVDLDLDNPGHDPSNGAKLIYDSAQMKWKADALEAGCGGRYIEGKHNAGHNFAILIRTKLEELPEEGTPITIDDEGFAVECSNNNGPFIGIFNTIIGTYGKYILNDLERELENGNLAIVTSGIAIIPEKFNPKDNLCLDEKGKFKKYNGNDCNKIIATVLYRLNGNTFILLKNK